MVERGAARDPHGHVRARVPEVQAADAGEFSGHNPDHNFDLAFDGEGVHVAQGGEDRSSVWSLRLSGIGYDGNIQPVGGEARGLGKRETASTMTGPASTNGMSTTRGLEQGFTVHAPPQGDTDADLILEMALDSDLVPMISGDAQSIDFRLADGNVALCVTATYT